MTYAPDKRALRDLADLLLIDDPDGVECCVAFFEGESRGYWHNRARAMIARRLKHCTLTAEQRERVTHVIVQRLAGGTFTEQFKDQLRLACRLEPERLRAVAAASLSSPKEYVRRYAAWVLARCAAVAS